MTVSRAEQAAARHNLEQYKIDQVRMEKHRTNEYAKKVEERRFDQIIVERVARNLRLDLDKGRNIDIEA